MMLVRRALYFLLLFCAASASAESVFELLNPNAQNALVRAQVKAKELKNPVITQAHMLWALLQDEQSEVSRMLVQSGGVDVDFLKAAVNRVIENLPKSDAAGLPPPIGDDLAKFLRNNCHSAHADLRDVKISSEAVLISMVEGGNQELREAATAAKLVKSDLMTVALDHRGIRPGVVLAGSQKTALDEFGVDLTETARRKGIPPIVGMKHEVDSIKRRFLGGRGKSIALVGRSGIGKTRVLEEIARLTALPFEQQPEQFRNKRLVVIDVRNLMADASFHGQAEGRIKAILEAAKTPVKGVETILVLDNMTAPEKEKAGTADFASALAREVDRLPGVILTCEEDVWHNYISGKTDLGKKVPNVRMIEPDKVAAFWMIESHRPALERQYGVKISDQALHSAMDLSRRFFAEVPEPRRSRLLLENVCETFQFNLNEMQAPVGKIEEEISRVKYEINDWGSREASSIAAPKLKLLREELDALFDSKRIAEEKFRKVVDMKLANDALSTYVSQLESYLKLAEREKITTADNKSRVQALLAQKKEELARSSSELALLRKDYPVLSPEISAIHVAQVVAREKKVPLGNLVGDVKQILKGLEAYMDARLIGQYEAKAMVRDAVYRYFTEIRDPNRPYVVRFKGETGVGKTELAKILSDFLFGNHDTILTLNMTEYTEKHTVHQLFGSPVGYEGHYEGGLMTNHVMKNPFTIVLIDEADKAARQVLTAFMRPFDEGKGADSTGRRVDYSNVIFIQTDNALNDEVFPPEYRNRIQDVVHFKPLTTAELLQVYDLKLKPVQDRIFGKLGISIHVTDEVKLKMAIEAENTFGARQIANIIERYVVNPVARGYVHDVYNTGDEVTIMKADDGTEDFLGRVTGRNSCAAATAAL